MTDLFISFVMYNRMTKETVYSSMVMPTKGRIATEADIQRLENNLSNDVWRTTILYWRRMEEAD